MTQPSENSRRDEDLRRSPSPETSLKGTVRDRLSSVIVSLLSSRGTDLLFGEPYSGGLNPSLLARAVSEEFKIAVTEKEVVKAGSVNGLEQSIAAKLQPKDPGLTKAALPKLDPPSSHSPQKSRGVESTDQIKLGSTIGDYRITAFLGRGGFARVYKAQHKTTGAAVAIKVPQDSGGGRQVTRFLQVTSKVDSKWISPDELPAEMIFREPRGIRIDTTTAHENDEILRAEARKLRSIDDPHWVRVVDEFEIGGRPVLVTNYLRGSNLRQIIRNLSSVHLNWFARIADVLERTEPHGDLKPENIIVSPAGKVSILDPGVNIDKNGYNQTPHYNPFLRTDARADVYSLGIMIYESLTGTLPFDEVPWEYAGREGGGDTQRFSASYFLSVPKPSILNPKTPEGLERIVLNCLNFPDYGISDFRRETAEYIARS